MDCDLKCCECGKKLLHEYHQSWNIAKGDRQYCCTCYVKNGGAPFDGHKECMAKWKIL